MIGHLILFFRVEPDRSTGNRVFRVTLAARSDKISISMGVFYDDNEIQAFVRETKRLPNDWQNRATLKPKRGHRERELDILGEGGSQFRLILRQSIWNPIDFSVILGLLVPKTSQVFRLLRCNGKSHEHTNRIENETFYDFHIHRATERYLKDGYREDEYATVTDKYSSFVGALDTLLDEAGFIRPTTPQMAFGWKGEQ